jgi:hypothetical protein
MAILIFSKVYQEMQTLKPQSRRPLFDVELYLTVHKSFVSTSLNIIIHRVWSSQLSLLA